MSWRFCGASSAYDFYNQKTFFTPCFVETSLICALFIPLVVIIVHLCLNNEAIHKRLKLNSIELSSLSPIKKAKIFPEKSFVDEYARCTWVRSLKYEKIAIFCTFFLIIFAPLIELTFIKMPPFHYATLLSIFVSGLLYGMTIMFALRNELIRVLLWIRVILTGLASLVFVNLLVLFLFLPFKEVLINTKLYPKYWDKYSYIIFLLIGSGYLYISKLLSVIVKEGKQITQNTQKTSRAPLTQKISLLIPYLWPRQYWKYQLFMVLAFICLVLGRIVNVVVPICFKLLVDSLNDTSRFNFSAITFLLLFVTGKVLQGNVGLVSSIQGLFWSPVGHWITKQISVDVFSHLHKLSYSFHTTRKMGEMTKVLDKGASSIHALLNSIIFSVGPTLVDAIIALIFFIVKFDIWFGLIIFSTMALFMSLTIVFTRWRTKFRRHLANLETQTTSKIVDSFLNFEAVKHFNGQEIEVDLFTKQVEEYQKADWICQISLYLLNTIQNLLISLGALLIGALLAIQRLHENDNMSIGDLVLFLTYVGQLYFPLNYLGTYYRTVQQHFIDMEKMLELLQIPREIEERHEAEPLKISRGEIVFSNYDNVSFEYSQASASSEGQIAGCSKKVGIKHMSCTIPAGKTVAFIGPSGSGKSSIPKLLVRFYDIQGTGSISIDNQNIQAVTLESLRNAVGIAPQDITLFYNTIFYNIKYAKPNASNIEVRQAASLALLNEDAFSEGFETQVGERGICLSGGEKQKMAIARILLKNPQIVILDEATSFLETSSERAIQNQLKALCSGRTMIIIAHRLSTTIHADKIIVLESGRIMEEGTCTELLKIPNGIYRELWNQQFKI